MNLPLEYLEELVYGCNTAGYCETCDDVDEHAGCEPDAEAYECPVCGENTLHGLEQALIMGMVSPSR
tara:strand:+ start:144 stop:344 length:201 start_codon:yes stop_codon:yes gene_type:complete